MLLNLTDLSSEPLHRQISIQLVRRMLEGDLRPGTRLPSLTAMARRQHVSKGTVELAYSELAPIAVPLPSGWGSAPTACSAR